MCTQEGWGEKSHDKEVDERMRGTQFCHTCDFTNRQWRVEPRAGGRPAPQHAKPAHRNTPNQRTAPHHLYQLTSITQLLHNCA